MNPLPALALLFLAGCATGPWERPQTIAEGLADCAATKHSPIVHLGADPTKTTIRRSKWRHDATFDRDEEFLASSMHVWTVNAKLPRFHGYFHRGLRLAGERFNNFSGTFRDEEHQLLWTVLDRDFPGIQDGKETRRDRRWAKERWSRPEYQVRMNEIEWKAKQEQGWCGRNGK